MLIMGVDQHLERVGPNRPIIQLPPVRLNNWLRRFELDQSLKIEVGSVAKYYHLFMKETFTLILFFGIVSGGQMWHNIVSEQTLTLRKYRTIASVK